LFIRIRKAAIAVALTNLGLYSQYMEEQDEAFMRLAIAQAHYSKQIGDVPFGAVITRHGKVIARAYNSEITEHDVTKHAEVKVVALASQILHTRNLSDCTIYSTFEPCPMCAGAIFYACINRIVFGVSRDDLPHLFRARNIRIWELARDLVYYQPVITSGTLKQDIIKRFLDYKQPWINYPTTDTGTQQQPSIVSPVIPNIA
jgi:guanine deaminase